MNVDDADMYKRFFMKTLRSEALYDLIDDQFRNNNLFAITERDIQKQLMDIITENPDVGDIIRDNGLDIKPPPGGAPPPAPPAAPPGAAPPGAAPPGAAPPGAAPGAATAAATAAASYLSGLYGRFAPGAAPAASFLSGLYQRLAPTAAAAPAAAAAAPAAAAAAAAPADAAMSLLPVGPSTRLPAAAASSRPAFSVWDSPLWAGTPTMPQMASIPQGGRPIPGQRLNTQTIEDMRQGEQRFSRFGATPSRASSPKLETFDISMDDPDIEMKETPEIMAQQILKEFRTKLMDMYEKNNR